MMVDSLVVVPRLPVGAASIGELAMSPPPGGASRSSLKNRGNIRRFLDVIQSDPCMGSGSGVHTVEKKVGGKSL